MATGPKHTHVEQRHAVESTAAVAKHAHAHARPAEPKRGRVIHTADSKRGEQGRNSQPHTQIKHRAQTSDTLSVRNGGPPPEQKMTKIRSQDRGTSI